MNKDPEWEQIHSNRAAVWQEIESAAARSGRDVKSITVVGVSKKQSAHKMQAYADQCVSADELPVFGENYVQHFLEKKDLLRGKFSTHFIGRLQSNKSKIAVQTFDVIQSCHSEKLLWKLNDAAFQIDKVQDVYLQVNISDDDAKSGFSVKECHRVLQQIMPKLSALRLCGFMTITRFYDDAEMVRPDFKRMAEAHHEFTDVARNAELQVASVLELSMGMSADFAIAIEEGATVVRVGTRLFGQRLG